MTCLYVSRILLNKTVKPLIINSLNMSTRFAPLNLVKQTNPTHSGTVIFFHGSGDTGNGAREWIKILMGDDIKFAHLQMVYPTASRRPYTPLNGSISSVWFDRLKITPDCADHKQSLDEVGQQLVDFIKNEVAVGIPLNRIVIGGFSMGGCLALHLGLRYLPSVAGIFSLSSFLGNDSLIYEELKSIPATDQRKQMPLFMCHGDLDDVVPLQWAQSTYANLKKLDLDNTEFHLIKNTLHELRKAEIKQLKEWIVKVLPPLESDQL